MHRLLVLCARLEGDSAYYQQLAQEASQSMDWAGVSTQAEVHGLGPLLYTHLQQAGVPLPPTVKRELQGLYLRHRHANEVRTRVLAEILAAYEAAGIEAVVLKGAALAHLVYPQPGLRPMRDLDLLVKRSQAQQAQRLLADLGFHAPLPSQQKLPTKHLPAASRYVGNFSVSVEIHHNLFEDHFPASLTLENLATAPLSFSLTGLTAYTLGYEEMLWHLCQHVIYHTNVWEGIRLIWVTDITGFAERFAAEIDWERVKRRYPLILNTLSLLHGLTPFSETVLRQAKLHLGRTPEGTNFDFQGWPRSSLAQQRRKGYRRLLVDTFFPSEWWLRLHYGLSSTHSLFWYRWWRHPLHILGWVKQLLLKRMR